MRLKVVCMNDGFTRNADEQTIKAVIPQITAVVQTISSRLQDTRDLVVRQTFGLNKFKGMGGRQLERIKICIRHKRATSIPLWVERVFSRCSDNNRAHAVIFKLYTTIY